MKQHYMVSVCLSAHECVCGVCVCACVRACVRECVRACVRACEIEKRKHCYLTFLVFIIFKYLKFYEILY